MWKGANVSWLGADLWLSLNGSLSFLLPAFLRKCGPGPFGILSFSFCRENLQGLEALLCLGPVAMPAIRKRFPISTLNANPMAEFPNWFLCICLTLISTLNRWTLLACHSFVMAFSGSTIKTQRPFVRSRVLAEVLGFSVRLLSDLVCLLSIKLLPFCSSCLVQNKPVLTYSGFSTLTAILRTRRLCLQIIGSFSLNCT